MSLTFDGDRIRWPGSGSSPVGKTPYGFYDNDPRFVVDCVASAKFAGFQLGFPVQDVELTEENFYSCFESAIMEYTSQINRWNIINNISTLQGQSIQELGNVSGRYVGGSGLPYIVELSQAYGTQAEVGGKVGLKKGYITTTPYQNTYDLQSLWGDVTESCNRLEIRRVLHHRNPAFSRIYDPFSMTGMSYSNIFNELGFGAYSPATQFLMTPIFEDLLRGQAIEFNDMVRKSQYGFEVVNNKLRVWPVPTYSFKLWFEYFLKSDIHEGSVSSADSNVVSDFSNVPYNNTSYSTINDAGKQWIRKYFLALCKEVLGIIRQKHQSIPFPDGEVTLDGAELRSEAQQEKEQLITLLREDLEKSGRTAQLEMRSLEAETIQNTLRSVPMPLYLG
jgi:hypothetical protein